MTIQDCLFCKISAGQIPVDVIYESDTALAFPDINPQAPTHALIIPKQHIATINDIENSDQNTIGSLFVAAREIAKQQGLADSGYRVVMNCNEDAGQTVFHLHLHFIGGRKLSWPPGLAASVSQFFPKAPVIVGRIHNDGYRWNGLQRRPLPRNQVP
jgi:histidine triad (HIT) family protein